MKKKEKIFFNLVTILSILFLVPIYSASISVIAVNHSDDNAVNSIKAYSPDGKGYLKELCSDKYLLHVEGSPYEMGYQHGYLCGENASKMANREFFLKFMLNFLGLDGEGLLDALIGVENFVNLFQGYIDPDIIEGFFNTADGELTEFIYLFFIYICQLNLKYVPNEFVEEMQGIADGATDAGYVVIFEDILLLNMAFELVLSILYPILTPIYAFTELFHSCNAYIVHGDATDDGRTIMGRDFMFPALAYQDVLLLEQVPNSGNKFVSTTAPGYVAVSAGMNSKGIGIGIDMCYAMDCTPGDFGMGSGLTARYITQYANELSEAVSIIKNSKRGVSWIYAIGDGRGSEVGGVIVEVSAHYCFTRYTDYKKPWYMPQINSQIEDKNDLVIATNHFITTEAIILSLSATIEDSLWRYETLTNLVLDQYGNIDIEKGKDLIDFLHPPNYEYYGNDTHQKVQAAKTCWDLTNLEVNALFGYYDDPWVNYHLEAI